METGSTVAVTRRASLMIALAVGVAQCVHAAGPVRTADAATALVESESSVSALTPLARARAERWGLSSVEWQRVESLMTGIRGSISPANISPIEVLGIHARDDAERQNYAERWAQLMREDVERILAFQRAYDEAGRRLYPTEQIIADLSRPKSTGVEAGLTLQDRILFFSSPGCGACDAVLKDVLRQVDRIAGIDLYLSQIALGDIASVRTWAAHHGISPEWVKTGRVTLNFEAGTLAKLGQDKAILPVILRRRGNAITQVTSTTFQ